MNTTELHIPSNKVRDIERYYLTELAELYPEGETRMFIRMLFEAFLGWDQVKLMTSKDETVNQSDLLRFHWAAEDLKRYRPIQHIIGYTDFCGCRLEVDESTLIPRPETEEIVHRTIKQLETKQPKRILDLCTGSGCIAIALAKQWPQATVTAIEISDKTLSKARRNAESNGVNIDFVQADILSDRLETELPPYPFDIIISNPPYIRESERIIMKANVTEWEPRLALFVPDEDPLIFYRAIARIAKKRLAKGGIIVLEINENLSKDTCKLLESKGFTTNIEEDFRGKERCIMAEWA